MDINLLFRAGERACGRVMRVLPKDEIGSPKQYMTTILHEETLPSINILYPRIYNATINLNQLVQVKDNQRMGYTTYRIPIELTEGLNIVGIKTCNPITTDGVGGTGAFPCGIGYGTNTLFTNKYGRYGSATLYEQVALAQLSYADNQLLGSVSSAPRFRFMPPNILLLSESFGTNNTLSITFLLENDPHLISIENSAYDAIKRLFILDIKKSIYNEYSIMNQIETPYGTVDLRIDDWSSAENDRNELFNEYQSTAHIRNSTIISG